MRIFKAILKYLASLKRTKSRRLVIAGALLLVTFSVFIQTWGVLQKTDPQPVAPQDMTYAQFMSLVANKEIKSVIIDNKTLDATTHKGVSFTMGHSGWLYSFSFPKELTSSGVEVSFREPASESSVSEDLARQLSLGSQLIFTLLFLVFMIAVGRRVLQGQSWAPEISKSTVRFSDVAGQDEAKFELAEVLQFMENGAAYSATGARPPKGALLVGPPGTGKTLLAKALAGEANAHFIAVNGSSFTDKYIGTGAARIRQIFEKARKNAPCILFIDEIDSVASARVQDGADVSRERANTVNMLLTQMDGFETNDGVFILGATNHADQLDPAILRKGRFDRHIYVGHSDVLGRADILAVHAKGKPIAQDVSIEAIAKGTPGFTGADLENLVNEAAVMAARRDSKLIEQCDFDAAVTKILAGIARPKAAMTMQDKLLVATHEAGHAVAASLVDSADPIHLATIIPHAHSLGMVIQRPSDGMAPSSKQKYLSRLTVLMAGRAAEALVFGDDMVTAGAAADIAEATKIATAMVADYGMAPEIGMRKVARSNGVLPDDAQQAVARILSETYQAAYTLLKDNKKALEALSSALLARETLTGGEIKEVLVLAA